jgi:hypothetical protein
VEEEGGDGVGLYTVSENDGHDVEGVGFDPGGYFAEVGLYSAGVEQVAGCVAEVQRVVDVVRLALEYAHAVVELLGYAVVLVARDVAGPCEGRVVRAHFGDVGVLAVAELDVVIAGLRVGGEGGRRLRSGWRQGPVVGAAEVGDGS